LHILGGFVETQTWKRRMSEPILGSPLHESNLRDEFGLGPLHFVHLIGRHATAPT